MVFPGSICLDSPFNFGISCQFYKLECSLAVVCIVILPDNTILLYSLAVILIVILPGIPFDCDKLTFLLIVVLPGNHFECCTPFDCYTR